MKTYKIAAAVIFALASSSVHASYFEFCVLEGSVVKAAKAKKKSSKIEYLVSKSEPSKLESQQSYDPKVCSNYLGKTIKIKFRTESKMQFVVGQQIKITQSVIDAKTDQGWATFTGWELHEH